MKKNKNRSKLHLEKFQIARINKSSKIRGGFNGDIDDISRSYRVTCDCPV